MIRLSTWELASTEAAHDLGCMAFGLWCVYRVATEMRTVLLRLLRKQGKGLGVIVPCTGGQGGWPIWYLGAHRSD